MSIHAFLLDGWDDKSTWGFDVDSYYAQPTPNGVDDANGPQIWISPPKYVIGSATELLRTIAEVIEVPVDVVDEAMARGMGTSRGEPSGPVPVPGAAPPPPGEGRAGGRDLTEVAAGQGILHEATRRRAAEGAGADRSWRVGADGEYAVGGLLAQLTEPSLWDRLRRRRPSWHVLHSVPSATATETSAATSTTS